MEYTTWARKMTSSANRVHDTLFSLQKGKHRVKSDWHEADWL